MRQVRKGLTLIFLVLNIATGFGQQAVVRNVLNNQPIERVYVYNLSKTNGVSSDSAGVVDLSAFGPEDDLRFTHPAFEPFTKGIASISLERQNIYLTPKNVQLEPFIVAANKRPLRKSEIPNRISIISAEEIDELNPQTSADLLDKSGSVYVQKSQMGGGSPMIRGFAANRVLIAVDGVRMNNAIFRQGNLQNVISIDPFTIQSTDVVYGPGSLIYGSDALGGVMDFTTRDPQLSHGDTTVFAGHFFSRYASANRERTIHFDLSLGWKKIGILTSYTNASYDDLIQGANGPDDYLRPWYQARINGVDTFLVNDDPRKQVGSGYKANFFMQKVFYKPIERLTLDYSLIVSTTSNIPRYDRLIRERDGAPRSSEWNYGPQEWISNALQITDVRPNSVGFGFYDKAIVTATYQAFEESRITREYQNPNRNTREESVGMFTLNADFDLNLSSATSIYYGYEGIFNAVGSQGVEQNINTGNEAPIVTRYPDGSTYNTHAAYAQYKHKLSKRLNFLGGVRFSYVNSQSVYDSAIYDFPFQNIDYETWAPSFSAGLAFRVNKNWQLNTNISSGFRAPNLDDLGKVFDSEPGIVVVPNAALQAEYSYNYDIGVYYLSNSDWSAELTGFATYVDNMIVREPFTLNGMDSMVYDGVLSAIEALQNVDDGIIAGAQFKFIYDISSKWQANIGGTYTWGEDSDGNAIRHVAPFFGQAHLLYSEEWFRADLSYRMNGMISNDRLAPSEQDKTHIYALDENGNPYSPQWYTINLRMNAKAGNHLEIDLSLENLTNQRYRTYSSGISAPGFNVIVGMRAWL